MKYTTDEIKEEATYQIYSQGNKRAKNIIHQLLQQRAELLEALKIADKFCGSLTADECPDSVHIPIRQAITRTESSK